MSDDRLILVMLIRIHRGGATSNMLEGLLGITRRTLGRYIDQARDMGAEIDWVQTPGSRERTWRLLNWPEIKNRTMVWLDLVSSRDLRDSYHLEGE